MKPAPYLEWSRWQNDHFGPNEPVATQMANYLRHTGRLTPDQAARIRAGMSDEAHRSLMYRASYGTAPGIDPLHQTSQGSFAQRLVGLPAAFFTPNGDINGLEHLSSDLNDRSMLRSNLSNDSLGRSNFSTADPLAAWGVAA